jgi:phospholipase C
MGDLRTRDVIQVGHDAAAAQSSPVPAIAAVPPVKHFFVLMLENRAFDHMLGFSGITGSDATTGLSTSIVGATASHTNTYAGHTYPASKPADFQVITADQGPPHEFKDILRQLCGSGVEDTYYLASNLAAGVYPPPNNGGFVYSYATGLQESNPPGEGPSPNPGRIMNCYDPGQLPVLTTLAREFAVCDNWFSSLPGPTWPNRFFVHAATSGGLATSPVNSAIVASMTVSGYAFANGDIYSRLEDRGLNWRVYEGDELPQVFSLAGMNWSSFWHYDDMEEFQTDLAQPTFTPTYVFIEPDYGNLSGGNAGQFLDGTSQHPRDDVRPGEILIRQVYEAIRNSPHWANSVLVITYDEHGGFYDHVKPPTTVAPGDGRKYETNANHFNFARLGVRVPAVIVSPLIPRGVIDHTLYDHTSILATLERIFGLKPLTTRDEKANDFRHLFSLTTPRAGAADGPTSLAAPPASFTNASGPTSYKGMTAPHVSPLPTLPPGGGTLIDSPIHRRPSLRLEPDLERLLTNGLTPPTNLLGDAGPDLLGWLHVAFRRRLALHPANAPERATILVEYCSIQTVAEAELFIELARQEVRNFRAGEVPVV